MRRRLFSMALLGLLVPVTGATAQTAQKWSIQGSALGVHLTGIANEDLAFGSGGELQLRFNPSAFSIGVGLQATRHELGTNSVTYNGVFVEPRYILTTFGDVVGLYGSARLMSFRAAIDILGVEVSLDGSAVAVGGGLLIRLGSRLNADVGVTTGKEFYDGEPADGAAVVTRLGLALGIG